VRLPPATRPPGRLNMQVNDPPPIFERHRHRRRQRTRTPHGGPAAPRADLRPRPRHRSRPPPRTEAPTRTPAPAHRPGPAPAPTRPHLTSHTTDPTSSTTPGARGNPRHPTRPPDPHHAPKHHNQPAKAPRREIGPAIHYSRIRVRPTTAGLGNHMRLAQREVSSLILNDQVRAFRRCGGEDTGNMEVVACATSPLFEASPSPPTPQPSDSPPRALETQTPAPSTRDPDQHHIGKSAFGRPVLAIPPPHSPTQGGSRAHNNMF
jgi:hypothetical protein